MSPSIGDQITDLRREVVAFEAAVAALPAGIFLAPLGRWTPRDIVAHLVGWNRYVIRGARQILEGELPFYDIDPGEDFANVNAAHVADYPSRDRARLLEQLRASAGELEAFLRDLDPGPWTRDHGVRHGDSVVTVRGTVDELIADYAHHRAQIEELAARAAVRGD